MPEEIGEGQQLALRLEAELTDGQTLTAQGGSWTAQDGVYSSTVG